MGLDPVTKFIIRLVVAAIGYAQQRKAKKRQERQARAARSNVLINKNSNNDPVYVVYGRQRIGGTRVFIECSDGQGNPQAIDGTTGQATNTTHLNMVLAMCEGEIDDIEQLWFNDTIIWDVNDATTPGTKTSNGNGGYTLTNFISKYAQTSMVWNWYPGSTTQTYDTALSASVGSALWNSSHRLQGVSYLAFTLPANGDVYGGQLPTVTAVLNGKKILNVNNLTEGDTSPAPGDYTAGADQSPADVLYDIMTSKIYGKGLDHDENGNYSAGLHIDLASFQQAKTDCSAARSGSGFNINGFMQTEKQIFDNIGEILEASNGVVLFVDGKYEFRIKKQNEQASLPTSHIFTSTEIIGEVNLSLPQKKDKLNKATGIFNNPQTKYNDDVIIYKDDAYIIEDNGSVLETQEDFTLVTDANQVEDLIGYQVEYSRENYGVQLEVSHKALLLKSGDIIEIRVPDLGWGTGAGETQKFWRVQELTLTENNTVKIGATTYDSSLEL